MDTILINSSHNNMNHLIMDSQMKRVTEMLPLGICYLATKLESEGFEVQVLDMAVLEEIEIKAALEALVKTPPKCVGISTSTLSYVAGMEVAAFLKDRLGMDFPVFMGGYHVTFEYTEALKSNLVDVVIRGEGEEVIGRVVDCLGNHKPKSLLCNIPGISFLLDGEMHSTKPDILRVNDLDKIPIPKRSYLRTNLYRNTGTIISSRGCVAKCQFCAAGAFGAIRTRSAENVAYEIQNLYDRKIETSRKSRRFDSWRGLDGCMVNRKTLKSNYHKPSCHTSVSVRSGASTMMPGTSLVFPPSSTMIRPSALA